MESKLCTRILLLDFGPPMNSDTVQIIKVSLQKVLTMASTFPDNSQLLTFAISILNSDYSIIESSTTLRKNYNFVITKLDSMGINSMINSKVTVQEYKNLLWNAINIVLHEIESMAGKKNGKKTYCNKPKQLAVGITVLTKKTGELLLDIKNKLCVQKYSSILTSVKNFKLIQILNEQELSGSLLNRDSDFVELLICQQSLDDLNYVFKEWLLKPDHEQGQLQIILSKDSDLILKCDIDDCIINPFSVSFGQQITLHNDFLLNVSNYIPPLGLITPTCGLEILYRIPLCGLCPTQVFGTPRRAYATTASALSWNELQINLQMFKELCRELAQSGQGLLTKSRLHDAVKEINVYYFITSDGDNLLINSVASDELYLPKRPEFLKPHLQIDQNATSIIKNCLQHIQFLEEYIPWKFSSGLYEYLKNYLLETAPKASSFRNLNAKVKLPSRRKKSSITYSQGKSKDVKQPSAIANFNKEAEDLVNSSGESIGFVLKNNLEGSHSQQTKKQKFNPELENKNLHPALLSPRTAEKYRKTYSTAFDLPELGQAYNDNLTEHAF